MAAVGFLFSALLWCANAEGQTCLAPEHEELPFVQIPSLRKFNRSTIGVLSTSGVCSSPGDAAAEKRLEQSLLEQPSRYGIQSDLEDAFEYVTGEVQTEYQKVEDDDSGTIDTGGKTSWLQRLIKVGECVTEIAVGEIPALAEKGLGRFISGGSMATVLGYLWPSSSSGQYDIWALLLNNVEELVNVSILNYELHEREGDFLSVRRYLTRYSRESTTTERGNDLSVALAKVEDIMTHLTVSTNKYELLPMTIVTATLHCAILRERVNHGKRLFGAVDPNWLYALQSSVAYYQSFFNYTFPLWRDWRSGLIKTTVLEGNRRRRQYSDCSAVVSDRLSNTGNDIHVLNALSESKNWCDDIANMTALRILNEVSASMANALQPIMYLQRYIPGMEDAEVQVLPAVEYVTVGPYAAVTQDLKDGAADIVDWQWAVNETGTLGPGNITLASAWTGNVIDYFRLSYESGGDETGGTSHAETGYTEMDSVFPERYIHTIQLHFEDVVDTSVKRGGAEIVNMKLFFSDGYNTGTSYGCFNRDDLPYPDCAETRTCCPVLPGPYTANVTVSQDPSYKLVGAALGTVKNSDSYYFGYINATFQYAKSSLWSKVNKTFSHNNLTTGQRLKANEALWSYNGLNKLLLSQQGNLAIYDMYDAVTWQTRTTCDDKDGAFLLLQPDGNLVLYCGDTTNALWASNTDVVSMEVGICQVAAIENTGALTIYRIPDLAGVWTSSGPIPVGFGANNLTSPRSLKPGQRLVQRTFYQFDLSFSDGAVELKDWSHGRMLWATSASCTASQDPELKMQSDGNLVLYCSGVATWDTGTADASLETQAGVNTLLLLENGNLAIVNKQQQLTWSSNSKIAYDYFADDYGIYDHQDAD